MTDDTTQSAPSAPAPAVPSDPAAYAAPSDPGDPSAAASAAAPPEPVDTPEETFALVRRFARLFLRDLPREILSSGSYAARPDDRFAGEVIRVPDGTYRIEGDDWLFKFKGCGFVEARRAAPPNFGGKKVIAVPNG